MLSSVEYNGGVQFSFPELYSAPPPFPANLAEGRSSDWRKLQVKTVTGHPYCAVCGCMNTLQVHHKKPFHLFPELELEPLNLIVLCQRDHFWIGHLFDWRAYNPNIDIDIILWNEKIKGRLYD